MFTENLKMKKIGLLILIVLLVCSCSNQQEIRNELDLTLKKKFSNVRDIEWEFENDIWEADFKQNNIKYSTVFDKQGNWIETEHEINSIDLPQGIQDSIKTKYQEYRIKEVEYIESLSGIFYEIELKQGHKEIEVTYDELGNFIKKENDNNNDD